MSFKKKYDRPTTVISHRITYDNLNKIDAVASVARTRTDILNEAIEFYIKKYL